MAGFAKQLEIIAIPLVTFYLTDCLNIVLNYASTGRSYTIPVVVKKKAAIVSCHAVMNHVIAPVSNAMGAHQSM